MTDTPPADARLDGDLIVLLDQALAMTADHLTSEQRANLWQRANTMGLGDHIERRCSPEVQHVFLSERPRVNPDGGQVGNVVGEPPPMKDNAAVEEGSAKFSGTPTA